jgi:hypothetical protein
MKTKIEVGQRVDIFEVSNDPYNGNFNIGGWYAEKPSKYSGNKYGRDMISQSPIPSDWEATAWHLNIPNHMKKVGTMVIKSIKP